jgi:hypothetical protein
MTLNPANNTAAVARLVCPATVVTSVPNFWVTNISFSMDAVKLPGTTVPAITGCDGYVETANGAVGVNPGANGVDTTEYPGENRIYYSCRIRSSDQSLPPMLPVAVRINGYKVFMAYYTK